ncbi:MULTISPECIES: polysaccharide lyase [Burkholderia cepacia complex]|uniref:polysaccharide lyase n=1 Tax=Burkholderia cepacia complex TaxID=87882 RepID=UPI001CF24B2F|nr:MULTISPECIES: polysaccharide lyase [Burkholderia cepacia complex]MCA8102051.1 polysaccharide lyase [Burkholderia contaminans]
MKFSKPVMSGIVLIAAGLGSILVVACATKTAARVESADYRSVYSNSWHSGLGGLTFQQTAPTNITLVNDPVASGRRAIRVELRKNQDFSHLINRLPRAEFLLPRDIQFASGHEYLIRWRTYLPSDLGFDSKQFAIITQIHQGAHSGSPPVMLQLFGSEYVISVRGGRDTTYDTQRHLCCAANDRGRWVDWVIRYAPDSSGRQAITQVWKDELAVFEANGIPNAYVGDQHSYLKFGIYKPSWQTYPTDVDALAVYFGDISVDVKRND